MRRSALIALSCVALALVPASAGAQDAEPTGPLAANVELLASIPNVGAIHGKVREVHTPQGTKRYLVVNNPLGLVAYDVTDPAIPVPAGILPVPHFESEDIEMGGDILLVVNDPAWTGSRTAGLYIIDISQLPLMTFAYVNPATGNRFRAAEGSVAGQPLPDPVYTSSPPENGNYTGGHTVSCVLDCRYALSVGSGGGSDQLYLIDLTDPSAPELARIWTSPVGASHDAQTDETGLVWVVGSGGFAAYDFAVDPLNPTLVARHDPTTVRYHHNSWRPNAAAYVPGVGDADHPRLDRGEVLLITEEEIYDTCASQGQFATASVVGLENSDPDGNAADTVKVLDRWTTELKTPANVGDPMTGNQPAAAVCSAHYFDERNGIVAIGWYQQGTRFLDVSDPTDIKQVGYWIPPVTVGFAATWMTDDIVYAFDEARGLDVLRFTGPAAGSGLDLQAPVPASVLRPDALPSHLVADPTWGYACSIVATRTS